MLKKIRSYVLNIVKILLIFFIIQNIFTPKCSAASILESVKDQIFGIFEFLLPEEDDKDDSTLVDPTENPEAYKPTIQDEENSLKDKTSNLLGAINTLGIVVSVISLTLIGIKYMLGSVEEKAEYKKTMIPYVLGFIMLSASTTIANLLYNISSDIFG